MSLFMTLPRQRSCCNAISAGQPPDLRWRCNGLRQTLGRALSCVDHEGEVQEAFITKTRDRHAAVQFLKKAMKRHGQPQVIVTDRLGSYRAAIRELGNVACQETGRWLNNRAENSHQPFRRQER